MEAALLDRGAGDWPRRRLNEWGARRRADVQAVRILARRRDGRTPAGGERRQPPQWRIRRRGAPRSHPLGDRVLPGLQHLSGPDSALDRLRPGDRHLEVAARDRAAFRFRRKTSGRPPVSERDRVRNPHRHREAPEGRRASRHLRLPLRRPLALGGGRRPQPGEDRARLASAQGLLSAMVPDRAGAFQGGVQSLCVGGRLRSATGKAVARLGGGKGLGRPGRALADRGEGLAVPRSRRLRRQARAGILRPPPRHRPRRRSVARGRRAGRSLSSGRRRERIGQVVAGARRPGSAADDAGRRQGSGRLADRGGAPGRQPRGPVRGARRR